MGNSIAYHQGISDFMRYHNRCPLYWKNTPDGEEWQRGYDYAKDYTRWLR